MKKLIISVFVLFASFFFLFTSDVSAKFYSDEKGVVNISEDEVVNDDLFIKAQTAQIDGTVNGDVFIGAQTIRIKGIINGSLYVGGQIVTLSGTVKGNVYIGAQDITITGGNIGNSLFIGGQNISLDNDSLVGGSLFAGAASLRLDSQIKRNAYAGVGIFNVGDNTVIAKDLYYAGQEGQVSISDKATISGTIHKSETDISNDDFRTAQKTFPDAFRKFRVVTTFFAFISALIVGYIYYRFFGKHFTQTSDLLSKNFLKTLAMGFLVMIAIIPGIVVLAITMIGIPIAFLSFLIFLIFLYMAKIVAGMSLGTLLAKRFNWKMSVFMAFGVGLLAIYVAKLIPFIGGFAECFAVLSGLGALTLQTLPKK